MDVLDRLYYRVERWLERRRRRRYRFVYTVRGYVTGPTAWPVGILAASHRARKRLAAIRIE